MRLIERLLVGVAILEIPLQVDTYLLYQEHEANFGAVGGINLSLTTLALVGLYLVWLMDAMIGRRRDGGLAMSLSLGVYIGCAIFSLLIASNTTLAVSYVTLLLQSLLLFIYIANRCRSKGDLLFLVTMLCSSLLLQSGIILASSFVVPAGGEGLNIGPVTVTTWADGRLCGTLSTPVGAGSFIALLLLPVGSMLLMPIGVRSKVVALAAVTLAGLALPLTQSRGAVLAVIIAAGIYGIALVVRGWLPKWAVVAAFLLIGVSAVPMMQLIEKRVASGDHDSAVSRIHLSQIAWNLIQDRPLLGVGAGNYHATIGPYENSAPFRSEWSYTVHCTYLLEWAEVGLVGLFAFVTFLLASAAQGWRTWVLRDPLMSPLGLAIAATIAGQMIHMLVDLFNSRPYMQTLWCLAALALAMTQLRATDECSEGVSDGCFADSPVNDVYSGLSRPPLRFRHG